MRELSLIEQRDLLEEKKKLKKHYRNKINLIEQENLKIHDDINLSKNKLLKSYNKRLLEGIDTRQEGLVWIIKSIWNLGKEVVLSYLPKFLDEGLIKYLFDVIIFILILISNLFINSMVKKTNELYK